MGKGHEIFNNQDMEKEYGIFLNQDKKGTPLAWPKKKLTN